MKTSSIWIFTKLWIVSAVVLAWFGSYSYFVGNKINPETSILEKIQSGIKNLNYTLETNKYSFDFTWDLEISQWGDQIYSGSVQAINTQIFSMNKWLSQRITSDNTSYSQGDKIQEIKNLDIIWHITDLYFSADIWDELLKNLDVSTDIKDGLSQEKYIHVDNKKTIQNTFNNFDENNIFIQLLLASATANPEEYLEKNNFEELFLQQMYKDVWIDYLFVSDAVDVENNKTSYSIWNTICADLENVSQELDIQDNFVQNCNISVAQFNTISQLFGEIYIQWDKDSGNYDFYISGWEILNIHLNYKKNILQNWDIKYDNSGINIDIQWNKKNISNSLVKIDIQEWEDNKISWEIINGSWSLHINTQNKISNIMWEINIKNYKIFNYDFDWNIQKSSSKYIFSGKGNDHSWEINFEEKVAETSLGKINLKYNNFDHNFSLVSENIDINSVVKEWNFALSFSEKNVNQEVTSQAKLVLNNDVLTGIIKIPQIDLIIEWVIHSNIIEALKVEWSVYDNEILYVLESEDFSQNNAKLLAGASINEQRIFDFNLEKISEKNLEDLYNTQIKTKIDIPVREIKINSNINIQEKIPTITFEIPSNTHEISGNISQLAVLPNIVNTFSQSYDYVPETLLTTTSIWWIFYYLRDLENKILLRNSLRKENLSIIFNGLEQKIISGEIQVSQIIWERKTSEENEIRFAWEKFWYSDNYQEWTLSGAIIETINGTQDIDLDEYMFAFFKTDTKTTMQVAVYLEDTTGEKKLYTHWNYVWRLMIRYDFTPYVETEKWEDSVEEIDENKDETQEIVNENTKAKITIVWFPHFRVWDMTNIGRVTEITEDYIWIDTEIREWATKIFLLWDDSENLFHDEDK